MTDISYTIPDYLEGPRMARRETQSATLAMQVVGLLASHGDLPVRLAPCSGAVTARAMCADEMEWHPTPNGSRVATYILIIGGSG